MTRKHVLGMEYRLLEGPETIFLLFTGLGPTLVAFLTHLKLHR
jgi:hypothetical protein